MVKLIPLRCTSRVLGARGARRSGPSTRAVHGVAAPRSPSPSQSGVRAASPQPELGAAGCIAQQPRPHDVTHHRASTHRHHTTPLPCPRPASHHLHTHKYACADTHGPVLQLARRDRHLGAPEYHRPLGRGEGAEYARLRGGKLLGSVASVGWWRGAGACENTSPASQ